MHGFLTKKFIMTIMFHRRSDKGPEFSHAAIKQCDSSLDSNLAMHLRVCILLSSITAAPMLEAIFNALGRTGSISVANSGDDLARSYIIALDNSAAVRAAAVTDNFAGSAGALAQFRATAQATMEERAARSALLNAGYRPSSATAIEVPYNIKVPTSLKEAQDDLVNARTLNDAAKAAHEESPSSLLNGELWTASVTSKSSVLTAEKEVAKQQALIDSNPEAWSEAFGRWIPRRKA